MFIDAPGHSLATGDFIKIAGTGDVQLPDGIYSVTGVTTNGFTVSRKAAPAAFPAVNLLNQNVVINAGATWQKIP